MASLKETQAAIEEIKDINEALAGLTKPLRKWKGITLHHSWKPSKPKWGVNYGKVFNDFHFKTNGWRNGCGYGFVVSWNVDNPSELKIWKTYRWKHQLSGAHAVNKKGEVGISSPNRSLIGICVVGDFDNEKMPEAAARAMDQKLIEPLLHALGLKASPATVFEHNQFDSSKTCPGTRFDMGIFQKEDGEAPKAPKNPNLLVGHKLLTWLEDVYEG